MAAVYIRSAVVFVFILQFDYHRAVYMAVSCRLKINVIIS